MKLYELTYLISPNLSEEEQKSLSEKITSHIQESKGVLKEIEEPKRKGLVTLNFESEPEKIADVEKKLKTEPQILRFMILIKKIPKAQLRPARRPPRPPEPEIPKLPPKESHIKAEKKVELKEIEKKLDEILKE